MKQRIYRCAYCKREMTVSPQSYAENKFCPWCLDERMEEATEDLPPAKVKDLGNGYSLLYMD